MAVRAAARRALARCGRLRGRPARIPGPSTEAEPRGSSLGESLMRVSIGAGEVELWIMIIVQCVVTSRAYSRSCRADVRISRQSGNLRVDSEGSITEKRNERKQVCQ